MIDIMDFLYTLSESKPEPTNSSIEEMYAYWGFRLMIPLKFMFSENGISVEQMDKFTQVLKEFVPKLDKIIKGEEEQWKKTNKN